MTVEFALDYIPRRMRELGFGNDYLTRWRHLELDPEEVLKIDADNEFFYLISPGLVDITVHSKFGTFNLKDIGITELQYEHRGKIEVTNFSTAERALVLFIQVIPSHKK